MFFERLCASELRLDERELASRLSSTADQYMKGEQLESLISACSASYVAERVPIIRTPDGVFIGGIYTDSKAFCKISADSDECFVLVATLGIGVDRLIAKKESISVSEAFIIDAIADAMVEALLDCAEERICSGIDTVPRFSPGYSDLPLSVGAKIVDLLGAETRLGIKFTESGLMVPKKSVSAIICIKGFAKG